MRLLRSLLPRSPRPQFRISYTRIPHAHPRPRPWPSTSSSRQLSSHDSPPRLTPEAEELPDTAALSEHDLRFGFYDIILPEEPYMWGTSHILPRNVLPQIPRPPYVPDPANPDASADATSDTRRKLITAPEDVVRLKRAARLAAETLNYAETLVEAGRTTDAIDAAVHDFVVARGAYPSPLLYKGFPKACCTSVNNVIAHGIPDDRPLQDGDIVNVDVTVYLDGFHGDTSRTFLVGDVDVKGRDLVHTTQAALDAAIAVCGPGQPFREIAQAIQGVLARAREEYAVSPMFTGHGIGREFHRRPWVYHTLNQEPEGMQTGDCFTIEPAIVQGYETTGFTFPDDWTVSTENCARSAQAEHMVYITDSGAEVLTRL
ncbi:methionine aminopeptidase [Epithele typhae]|uniref:methionine aminopeptidase n=1 Tax=Epithele typhae TaxID=378194 RepID=UPI00200817D0|nr:methionine aminopeptidase [Epithele typhae]KAH9939306.1 methionine aminopeptidase [Epithele typhae]